MSISQPNLKKALEPFRRIRAAVDDKMDIMAEAHNLPVAPHDCTGPVVLAVSTALSLNAPNALIQEVVRAFYTGWYRDVVTEVNRVANGYIYPLTGPGLGLTLRPDLLKRPDVTIRGSGLKT